MPFWRRRETLHERLSREGGLEGPAPLDPRPGWMDVGIHGVQRPREWDVVVAVAATGPDSHEASFVATAGGVFSSAGALAVAELAAAVDEVLDRPYRADAVRRGGDEWSVAARSIWVETIPAVSGDEVELAVAGGERTLRVDGKPAFGTVRELEELADGDAVVRARRIDGELFEVAVDPL